MPLYKTRIPPQKITSINNSLQTVNNNSLKIPVLRDDKNKVNDRCETFERDKIRQKKTGLKTNISAEMHISFKKIHEIENGVNGVLKVNEKKDVSPIVSQKKNATDDIKRKLRDEKNSVIDNSFTKNNKKSAAHKNPISNQKNAAEHQRKEIVTSRSKKNSHTNMKKGSIKPIDNTKHSENKIPSENVDFNNNTEITQTQTKKNKSRKRKQEADVSSTLEESVISLWTQEQIATTGPPEHLSHQERLLWLQEQRNVGVYVCCDTCNKYRYLKDTIDPLELPEKWYCYMNPDKGHNKCTDPEVELSPWEEEDLIYNKYHAGSIVWARLDGYPWWPAMVDDDPDTEVYYWLEGYLSVPTYYHVVFFDSEKVSRAWLKPEALSKFKDNVQNTRFQTHQRNKYRTRINVAKKQADDASALSVPDRLKKYSFLARWPGSIHPPINIKENKVVEKKHKHNKLAKDVKKQNKGKINTMKNRKSCQSSFKSLLNEICNEKPDKDSNNNYASPDLFDDDTLTNNIAKFPRTDDLSFSELDMLF